MISERTKAGLARSNKKLGMTARSKAYQRRIDALGLATIRKAAMERGEAYRLHIEWALRQPGWHARPISVRAAADKLNERNIESPRGGRWWAASVMRMGRRLALHHPLAGKRGVVLQEPRGQRWGMDDPWCK